MPQLAPAKDFELFEVAEPESECIGRIASWFFRWTQLVSDRLEPQQSQKMGFQAVRPGKPHQLGRLAQQVAGIAGIASKGLSEWRGQIGDPRPRRERVVDASGIVSILQSLDSQPEVGRQQAPETSLRRLPG